MQFNKFNTLLYFLVGTLILLIPALSNNYPFVYSDTGTYILSGFKNEVPADRTIFYGLFLRHLSLKLTFWIPVILQSFFAFYLIHLLVKYYIKHTEKRAMSIAISFLLVTTTGIGLFVGKLMPDIFTAYIILCVFLLVFTPISKNEKIFLSFLLFISLLVHLSNNLSTILIIVGSLLYLCVKFKFNFSILITRVRKLYLVSAVLILSLLTIPFTNYLYYNKFETTAGGHVFLLAKLNENGLLRKYLQENCKEKDYQLCNYVDDLPPSAINFIWTEQSPFYKTGGWENSKEEYDEIISNIFLTPKYWQFLAVDFLSCTFKQFFTFSPGVLIPHREWSPPHSEIKNHMRHELNEYMISIQQANGYDITDIERRQKMLVYFSLALLLICLFSKTILYSSNTFCKEGILFILFMLLVNAFICGALANVVDRLQGRVIWILPLVTLIIVSNFLMEAIPLYLKKTK